MVTTTKERISQKVSKISAVLVLIGVSFGANGGLPTINDIKNAVHKGASDIGHTAEKAGQDVGHTAEKAAHDAGHTVEKAAQDSGHTAETAAHDAGNTLQKAVQDTGHALEKAAHDTGNTAEKAAQDTGATMEKAVRDTGDAGAAIGRFINREAIDLGQDVSESANKTARGKVVDGLWELGTRPLKSTEENAGKVVRESSVLSTVGQIAATVYGGPGGAAAFATWATYKVTGNLNLALRAGMITGATSLALQGVSKMPAGTTPEIARKAVAAGTVSALAVAVSGGDIRDVKKGFAVGAGMIIIQAEYQNYTGRELDAKQLSATKGGDCMLTSGAACSPPDYVLVKDSTGKVLYGDPTKFRPGDPVVNFVGVQVDANTTSGFKYWVSERSPAMEFIGKNFGAANAGGLAHDKLVIQFHLSAATSVATIAPVMVMTYAGAGASVYSGIQNAVIKNGDKKAQLPAVALPISDSRDATTVCTRPRNPQVVTKISVDIPDKKTGFVCEVTKQTGNGITRPWHAANDIDFCAAKARDMTTEMMGTGWACLAP